MSQESRAILYEALDNHQPDSDPAPLRAAAIGHLGASRRLDVLMEEYAEAMEDREHHTPEQAAAAQAIADELAPVSVATRIASGLLPGGGAVVTGGG